MKTVVVFTDDESTASFAVDGGDPHPLRDGEVKLLSVEPSLTLRWEDADPKDRFWAERQFRLDGDADANLVVNGPGDGHARRDGDGDGDGYRRGSGTGHGDRFGSGRGCGIRDQTGDGTARFEDEHGYIISANVVLTPTT